LSPLHSSGLAGGGRLRSWQSTRPAAAGLTTAVGRKHERREFARPSRSSKRWHNVAWACSRTARRRSPGSRLSLPEAERSSRGARLRRCRDSSKPTVSDGSSGRCWALASRGSKSATRPARLSDCLRERSPRDDGLDLDGQLTSRMPGAARRSANTCSKASTTAGSNCEPAQRFSSMTASVVDRAAA
jgi:hypothetical protein